MILLPLNPGTYAGRKFTVRYQTNGYYEMEPSEQGFSMKYIPLETPAEGNRAGIPANPGEFRDVIRGKIIRFDTGDELVIVPQVQQLLELPDIGGSEMFIRGVEHFQHDSSVTFNGHTQCLTGFTQVILEPQPQRVVMRVGTLGQNGANRPQFIDTT